METVSSTLPNYKSIVNRLMLFRNRYISKQWRMYIGFTFITCFLLLLISILDPSNTTQMTIADNKRLLSGKESSKSTETSEKCKSSINPKENMILNTKLCDGGYIIDQNDDDKDKYIKAISQFAALAHPENVNPSFVIYARCDSDIKLVLKYALECDYKVSVRSGGHQYSGLSSCNSNDYKCIQLDVSSYNKFKFISDDDDGTIVEFGAGSKLGLVTEELINYNNLFIPHGDCMTVAIGGHFQTSGQGHMHNKFGTFNNHVIGYDMILVNGTDISVDRRNNLKLDKLSNYVDNALRVGQSPGNWGIITKIRIKPLNDNDYKTSIFYQCDWKFDKNVLKQMLYIFKEYYESDDDKYESYNFYLRICKGNKERYGNIIRWRANYIDINDYNNNDDIFIPFNKFIDTANKYSKNENKIECAPLNMKPSDYQLNSAGIPYVYKEKRHLSRMQVTPYKLIPGLINLAISDGFINSFVDELTIIHTDKTDKYKGIYSYIEMTYNTGHNKFLQVNSDIYWDQNINNNGREIVQKFIDSLWNKLMNTLTFGFGYIDIRVRGATFGNINIDDVWQYYFHWDLEKYHKSQKIKSILDPNNVLSNAFTVKPYGMTQTKIDFQTYIFNDFQNDRKLVNILYYITCIIILIIIIIIGYCCWTRRNKRKIEIIKERVTGISNDTKTV